MVGHDKAVAPMKCQAPPCDREAVTAGYCPKHYQQIRRCGRLTPEREYGKRQPGQRCRVEDCDGAIIARGYCDRHYQQVRRHGRLIPERERSYGRKGCRVEGCEETHFARGFCKRHYMSEYYLPRRRKAPTLKGSA